ncbi:MAG: arginine deiminase family protein [Promethearchaeota archaeon]
MWTVKSEAGRLRTVAVHGSWYRDRIACPGLQPFQNSTLYERGKEQLDAMTKAMQSEGVKVYEWSTVLKEIVEHTTLKERSEIIESIWGDLEMKPSPEGLIWQHLCNGYPLHPFYDESEDEITWGPQFSGAGAAPRDDSFNTQIGMVISNMRQFHRQIAPRFSKLIYQWYPDFQKNIEIIWDAHQYFQGNSKYLEYKGMRGVGASIEGGDIQPIDEETLLCGVGLRSNIWGFQTFLKKIFVADREKRIKKVCAVKLIDHEASRVTHLDTVINWPDRKKAIVLPYVLESEYTRPRLPKKKLWIKLIEARRRYLERYHQPIHPAFILDTKDLMHSGEVDIYERNSSDKPVLIKREKNLLDFLITEDKLDNDGVIPVGGWPEKENDVLNLILTMQQQGRTGVNGVTIKPGLFMVWESNTQAVKALEEAGVNLIKLKDANVIGGAGPHCYTCPLERDAL